MKIMLPILGKNKTNIMHSTEQFEMDSISQQKYCINKPLKLFKIENQGIVRQYKFNSNNKFLNGKTKRNED